MDFLLKKAMENTEKEDRFGSCDSGFGEARIVVLGSGGAGNNTINRLSNIGISGAQLVAVNTDKQHLEVTKADKKMLMGFEETKGLGAGGYPEVGEQAAVKAKPELREMLEGADLIFLTGGLGGGTGTGSLPVIAEVGKETGAVVVAAVTMPFKIERARIVKAKEALKTLKKIADSVVVIDNNKLLAHVPDLPINHAFGVADEVLARMVKGITETIASPSLVNLDFADVRSVMSDTSKAGVAMIGLGESDTRNRAEEAVIHALENPLLDVDYRGATGAMVHITGGPDLTLGEATKIGELATSYLSNDASVIWGARIDPEYEGRIQVMVIMTGVSSPDILGPNDEPAQIKNQATGLDFSKYLQGKKPYGGISPRQTVQRPERMMTDTPKDDGRYLEKFGIDYIV